MRCSCAFYSGRRSGDDAWSAVCAECCDTSGLQSDVSAAQNVTDSAQPAADKAATSSTQRPRVLVTISKETTYITEPLRKDGYPDYVAALNQRCSQGVTPENNAAVLLWKAMGPGRIGKDKREKFFEMLGVLPLPVKGEYFVDFDLFVDSQEAVTDAVKSFQPDSTKQWQSLDVAMTRPWSEQEFPVLAKWVAANEEPLAILLEASKRPRRYDPIVAGKTDTTADSLLWLLHSQPLNIDTLIARSMNPDFAIVRTLLAHAMLQLNRNKAELAWDELLACHRLARLTGQSPTLLDAVVADNIERATCAADQGFLQHAKLTAARIGKMRDDLAKLEPMPEMADKIDLGERFMFLDACSMVARNGLSYARRMIGFKKPESTFDSLVESSTDALGFFLIDWNLVFHIGNSDCSRAAEAYRKTTRCERKAAVAIIYAARDELTKSLQTEVLTGHISPQEALSRWFGELFVDMLLPVWHCRDIQDVTTMQFDVTELAFELAQYRAVHRAYPAKLSELVPTYVREVPRDIFKDADLHYQRVGEGYVLYSVGLNGEDDGGKTLADWKEGEGWDDLAVRIPATK